MTVVARRLRATTAEFTPSRWNAPYPLVVPTYDGSNQTVHPSVIDFGSNWNGYRFWMAHTPYPNSNDDYENPSIVASSDGATWVEPAGITNPFVPWPGGSAYNADPDLVYDGTSTLHCFHIGSGDIKVISSTDGVTWGSTVAPFTTSNLALSPTVIKDGSTYKAWYVMPSQAVPVKYRSSSSPTSGWSAETGVTMPPPSGRRIWHLEVKKHDGTFLGLICTDNGTNGQAALLHLGASTDGLTWTVGDAVLSPVSGRWDSGLIYRASMRVDGTDADVWYSAKSSGGQWKIGRTSIPLFEFPTP